MLIVRIGSLVIVTALVAPSNVCAEEEATPESPPGPSDPVTAPTEVSVTKNEKKKKKKPKKKRDGMTLPWKVSGTAGMLSGSGTLVESAATTDLAAEITPTWQRGTLELNVPVKAEHRQTFGASLTATDARAGVEATYRDSPRFRVGSELELRGVYKPNWPDQYQPLASGDLGETDRYGHFDIRIGASVAAIPLRHWHARLGYRISMVDYANDPTYDMIDEPTHLVPGDHTAHVIDGHWRYFADRWKAGVSVMIEYASYDYQYSRDAGTGLTHAGPGGPPPNPLYEQASFEPEINADLELAGGRGEIDVSYGYEIVNDQYEGYYTYRGHHPAAKLAWRLARLELAAKVDLKWRRYGPDSYAAGGAHPPLEYGDRRVDRRFSAGLDVRYPLTAHWSVIGEADALIRRTNFPNYVPNVFPASRQYDIEWSYDNYLVRAGVEYRP